MQFVDCSWGFTSVRHTLHHHVELPVISVKIRVIVRYGRRAPFILGSENRLKAIRHRKKLKRGVHRIVALIGAVARSADVKMTVHASAVGAFVGLVLSTVFEGFDVDAGLESTAIDCWSWRCGS